MWLPVSDKKTLINFDHVIRIYAESHGKGSGLYVILVNGQTFLIREFPGAEDAMSVLKSVKKALGTAVLKGTALS